MQEEKAEEITGLKGELTQLKSTVGELEETFALMKDTVDKIFSIYEFQLGFPNERDNATIRDNGTEVPSLSREKGTTGQAKNLAKGRDGPGQPKFGTGRAGTAKIRDGTRDKTGQSRKGHSKTGK